MESEELYSRFRKDKDKFSEIRISDYSANAIGRSKNAFLALTPITIRINEDLLEHVFRIIFSFDNQTISVSSQVSNGIVVDSYHAASQYQIADIESMEIIDIDEKNCHCAVCNAQNQKNSTAEVDGISMTDEDEEDDEDMP